MAGGHVIVGNIYLPVGTLDYFLASSQSGSVNNSLFHSNVGGSVYEGTTRVQVTELHTVVTRAAAPFVAADLGPGQIGFRQDTGELFFNLPGGVRKVTTTS